MTDPDATEFVAPPGPDARYRRFLAEGRFMIQRCSDCARHVFAPRVLCKHCGSDRLDWVPASGQATVYATTVIRRRSEAGGPYLYGLFELREGERVISTVVDADPASVRIGDPVSAEIETKGEGPRLVFRLTGGAA